MPSTWILPTTHLDQSAAIVDQRREAVGDDLLESVHRPMLRKESLDELRRPVESEIEVCQHDSA